ncbi:MAG: hypothetical protein WC441_02620 [Patescibacteria group bacterium]
MKRVLLVDPLNCSLTVPIENLCNCKAQQVFSLQQAGDQVEEGAYDFMIIDPYRFPPKHLAVWLADLRFNKPALKIIMLSSCERGIVDQSFRLKIGLHYDFFVHRDPWPVLKQIINN